MSLSEEKQSNNKLQFTDVAQDAWYASTVMWALEKGITSGTFATAFSPITPEQEGRL